MNSNNIPVVAIDGPSGSGKGTMARRVAETLQWRLLDSGTLYRIVGFVCQASGHELLPEEEAAIAQVSLQLDIQFDEDGGVAVDGRNVTDLIRTEDAGVAASKVAAMPSVRDAVLAVQHAFRQAPGLVADGRDMGTVVFPDATVKIFLDASAEERAQRRYKQLKNKGLSVSLPGLLAQIQDRDARDRGRTIAPLKPAADAVIIDSTSMDINAVFARVIEEVRSHGL